MYENIFVKIFYHDTPAPKGRRRRGRHERWEN
jgi:hypothetical protein